MSDEQELITLQNTVREKYTQALEVLGVQNDPILTNRFEDIAKAYDGDELNKRDQTRFYHDLTHVTDLLKEVLPNGIKDQQDALATLAIINHDVIYAHMDRGIEKDSSQNMASILAQYSETREGGIFLNPREDLTDSQRQNYEAVLNIFDVSKEQAAGEAALNPNRGQNELLSALLLVDDLEKAGVPMKDQLVVIADIAATVPFLGEDHLDKIANKVKEENGKLPEASQLTLDELEKSTKYMVDIANADVSSFTKGDFAETFKDSQNLMLEAIKGRDNSDPDIASAFLKGANGTSFFMGFLSGETAAGVQLIYHGAEIAGVGNYSSDLDLPAKNEEAIENIKAIKIAVDSQIAATKLLVALNGDDPKTSIQSAMNNITIPEASGRTELDNTEQKALSGISGEDGKKSPFLQTKLAAYLLEEGGKDLITAINGAEKAGKKIEDVLKEYQLDIGKLQITPVVAGIEVDSLNQSPRQAVGIS